MNQAERKQFVALAEKMFLGVFNKNEDRAYHFIAHLKHNGALISVALDPLCAGRLMRLIEDRFGPACCNMTDKEYEEFVAFRYTSKLTQKEGEEG
ncbi:hypothetical protein LCGC14_1700320 [marine sediment metagenome]|uniref:Uncharacterized protein n=1 Tax=marine sediment metagenome TaxID=412755 RepID=A0A0F9HHY9_9ZZZZ